MKKLSKCSFWGSYSGSKVKSAINDSKEVTGVKRAMIDYDQMENRTPKRAFKDSLSHWAQIRAHWANWEC